MAGFDVQRVIAAYQQGRQIKDDKEKKVRDSEDRDWELKQRKKQLEVETIQQQIMKRKLEQENVSAQQGQPGEEITIPGFNTSETPGMQQGEASPLQTGDNGGDGIQALIQQLQSRKVPTFQAPTPGVQNPDVVKDLLLPSMQVSGVEGLGVGGYTAYPKSMKEQLRQARGEKAFESGLKQEEAAAASSLKQQENTILLPAALLGGKPTDPPVSVDKSIADNLLSGVQQDARQNDQQGFTQTQNEADRKSREDIAASNRAASQARADKSAEARIQAAKVAAGNGTITSKQQADALRMANSLKSHPAYSDMLDIDGGMKGVVAGLAQKNGFGDVTAINSFQRMVDPGATVREGDVALLQSAAGILDKINTEYPAEVLMAGAKLPDAVRKRMMDTAKALHETRGKNYNNTIGNQYRLLAKAAGIPFELIGSDFQVGAEGGGSANPYRQGGVNAK